MFKRTLFSLLLTLGVTFGAFAQELNVIVLADVHIMAPELIVNDGESLNKYVLSDRKLLRESAALLDELTKSVIEKRPDYVLIAGDLTKDGELVSHKHLVEKSLNKMAEAGIQCLVAPGNHDINNPHAVAFDGDSSRRVETISAEDFAKLYAPFGYGEAIARDQESLSYVYCLSPKLRLLSIDACKYYLNDFEADKCRHDGYVRPSTMLFIEQQLKEAKEQDIEVIALMHHNLLPHWSYQDKMMKGYVIDDYKTLSKSLRKLGLKVIFTGHSHAHDIAMDKGLYDIQTGSAVTFPSPYRHIVISEDRMDIKSDKIAGIEYDLQGMDFEEYSRKYTSEGLSNIVTTMFSDMPTDIAQRAGDTFAECMIAHYSGDEVFTSEQKSQIKSIARQIRPYSRKWSMIFRKLSYSLLEDGMPSDKELVIEFNK